MSTGENGGDAGGAAARLAWLELQDGTFPAGRFVHSAGLEAWLGAHPGADEEAVGSVVAAHLSGSVATLDAVFLAAAWRAPGRAPELDDQLTAYKTSAAARSASEGAGRQLAFAATRVVPGADRVAYLGAVGAEAVPGNQAVVDGVVSRHAGVGVEDAVLGFLRGAAAGLLSAAVRLGRIGPLSARRLGFAMHPDIAALTCVALGTSEADVYTATPELEIHAMRHERSTGRLFTT
ncbi:MAG: urease accessory protein UreF [Actinomycetota bacterium]|nr:urease accessory protein UreF [Actinomycetota bacterium]